MMRVPRTFGNAPHRALLWCGGDYLLGFVALLFIGALIVSLQSRHILAPKVLAVSNGQCDASDECTGGSYTLLGIEYYCSGYPECAWKQRTDDPTKPKPTEVCCISNGQFANCVLLSTDECTVNPGRTEAVLFSGPTAMTQCNLAVNASGRKSCVGLAHSSASSRSASSAPATRCGDNTIQTLNSAGEKEQCDWGTGNSDTLPDKCRKNCTLPHCGDKVMDSGEECDNTIPGQVDDFAFTWGGTVSCNSNCTRKVAENPLYMMFTVNPIQDSPLYMILPIDWQSIFFPFSSLAF